MRSAVPVCRFSPGNSSSTMAFIALLALSGCAPRPGGSPFAFGARQSNGSFHSFQQLFAKVGGHQDAGLELQDTWIKGGEDGPDAILIEMPHNWLGALRMIEL